MATTDRQPWWAWSFPLLGWLFLLLLPHEITYAPLLGIALIGCVFAAVHHAEILAHKVGEPYGSLLLAVAVTVIEVGLIVSLMLTDPVGKAALARDTVFAALMIVCNGLVGLCLLLGGARHHEQTFRVAGASAMLSVIAPLAVLVLVLPEQLPAEPGPYFAPLQLAFVSVASLALYGALLFVQTVRHREYFLPEDSGVAHAAPPPPRQLVIAGVVLPAALIAVVLLAKSLSPALEAGVAAIGAPGSVVGIVIALLVLLPESLAAVRAARRNRLQTSLNLALGSVGASIGLTIPAVAIVSFWIGQRLTLGISPAHVVLLWLTLLVAVLTLGTGRTTVLQGVVHLVLFAVYLFSAFAP